MNKPLITKEEGMITSATHERVEIPILGKWIKNKQGGQVWQKPSLIIKWVPKPNNLRLQPGLK